MSISNKIKQNISDVLRNSLRTKFKSHNPEPASMPFHTRLLGKDRLALYQFIHSLNTNFGTTIFEPVAIKLAEGKFKIAKRQYTAGKNISESALFAIQKIIDNLSTAESLPDKKQELQIIKKVCKKGIIREVRPTKVDLYLESKSNELFLIDLKDCKTKFW